MIESEFDGRGVIMPWPGRGWFGVVLGMTEDGADYLVEVLSVPYDDDRPILFVSAAIIERYLSDAL